MQRERKFFEEKYGVTEADLEKYLAAALSAGGEYADSVLRIPGQHVYLPGRVPSQGGHSGRFSPVVAFGSFPANAPAMLTLTTCPATRS